MVKRILAIAALGFTVSGPAMAGHLPFVLNDFPFLSPGAAVAELKTNRIGGPLAVVRNLPVVSLAHGGSKLGTLPGLGNLNFKR